MQMLLQWDLRPAGYESRMFCGFRSRWMIPLLCRTLMAPTICCRNTRMVSSLRVPLAANRWQWHSVTWQVHGGRMQVGSQFLSHPNSTKWCSSFNDHWGLVLITSYWENYNLMLTFFCLFVFLWLFYERCQSGPFINMEETLDLNLQG